MNRKLKEKLIKKINRYNRKYDMSKTVNRKAMLVDLLGTIHSNSKLNGEV